MRFKLLGVSLAGCLVVLAAWLVYRDDGATAAQAIVAQVSQPDKTPEHADMVRKGLEYLVKNQFPDGHWEGDGGMHPVAMTGLVGLALLMEQDKPVRVGGLGQSNRTLAKAKYAANIRKAADWLMDQSQPERDGLIFSGHDSETARYMEGHGLAMLFLAGVCQNETDKVRQKKLTDVLTRAVKYIAKARSSQGGWYHTSRAEGHDLAAISTTAIQIQALQAAENARIAIPTDAINAALAYLNTAIEKDDKATPAKNASRPADAAAALACRVDTSIGLGRKETNNELAKKWFKDCNVDIPIGSNVKLGRDELVHYYYAQALFNGGGDPWTGYRKAMFDRLQSSQNKDGSWPDGNGIGVGPVYSTAVWCIVLQLDNESHPSRRDGPMVVF